ncbi:MAG: hypothetical protein MPJ50_01320 [Pirellulales bacterium]|nr:hypothetical protein [Pirellulales bacterium]
MKTALFILAVVVILGLAVALFAIRRPGGQKTRLVKSERVDENGNARRVYLRRPGLTAKVWFERSTSSPNEFDVHHSGDIQGYSVSTLTNEPLHLVEAREGLHDLGMDIDTCSWRQLLKSAK